LKENIESLQFDLSEEEVAELCKLDAVVRICDADAWMASGSIFA
jgi:diketogulonate reductase-like aldo/keto reductase